MTIDDFLSRNKLMLLYEKYDSEYIDKVFNGNFSNPGLRKAKLSDFCILLDRGTSFYIFEKIFKD